MGPFATLRVHQVKDFEQLRDAVPGARRDVVQIAPSLPHALLVHLGDRDLTLTADAAEFWKRAFIDATTANLVKITQSDRDGPPPSALKIVRRVEDYVGASGTTAIHISEICSQLHLTRRTLHRAFHEAVGIGPIAFLRYLRLCAVHTALRAGLSADDTIANLALAHGFLNVGRFAFYYRQLFGENPSDTRRKRAIATTVQAPVLSSSAR